MCARGGRGRTTPEGGGATDGGSARGQRKRTRRVIRMRRKATKKAAVRATILSGMAKKQMRPEINETMRMMMIPAPTPG